MPRFVITTADGSVREEETDASVILIGRSSTADVQIRDAKVSKLHVRIEKTAGGYRLRDLGSANGTLVNGLRVEESRLADGDELTLGGIRVRFHRTDAGGGGVPAAGATAARALAVDWHPVLSAPGPRWLVVAPYWAISALLHLILCLVLVGIAVRPRGEPGTTPIDMAFRWRRRDHHEVERARPRLRPVAPPPAPVERPPEVIAEVPKGTDAVQLLDLESWRDLVEAGLGPGQRTAGPYGARWGKEALVHEGGSAATESAVGAALEWLRRHQSPDGSWGARDFVDQCDRPCRNRAGDGGDGLGPPAYDVGVTGLAMLAFAGCGHTHVEGVHPEYVECLKRAVRYLKSVQVRSGELRGRFGGSEEHWVYNHAIATMALAELLAISRDVLGLRRSVHEAVELILRMQNRGSAWRYGIRDGQNDVSVTGWMILALKTARAARLDIPPEEYENAIGSALRFIDGVTDGRGLTGYTRRGEFRGRVPCMTAVAVLMRLLSAESRTSAAVRKGVDACLQALPVWDEPSPSLIDIYYWYHASYALFQFGGREWRTWNRAMRHELIEGQRRGGDEDGSWDPIGAWGPRAGRVYSTAMGAMTLEVYYRFTRAQE